VTRTTDNANTIITATAIATAATTTTIYDNNTNASSNNNRMTRDQVEQVTATYCHHVATRHAHSHCVYAACVKEAQK